MEGNIFEQGWETRKQDGFKDEQYFVIPTESFENYARHPLVRTLYLTDIGFSRRPVITTGSVKRELRNIFCFIAWRGKVVFRLRTGSTACMGRRFSVFRAIRGINTMQARQNLGVFSGFISRGRTRSIIRWRNVR